MNFSNTERSPEKQITVSQYDRKSPCWNQAIEMNVILIFETSVKLRALNYDSQLILGEIVMRSFLHFEPLSSVCSSRNVDEIY